MIRVPGLGPMQLRGPVHKIDEFKAFMQRYAELEDKVDHVRRLFSATRE